MPRTRIPKELSSTTGIVDNSTATAITIDSSQNVGIGVSPSQKLEVNGTAVVNQLNINSASYDNRQLGMDSNGFFIYNSADARYDMVISDTGSVGIGTNSPTEKLTVNGALAITGALADDRTSTGAIDFSGGITRFVSYGASGVGGIFAFRTASGGSSSTERMRIDSSGNLVFGTPGIGSSTAGSWLSFEGNADAGGEGSGRIFFREHNSTTADMDDYGMSIGYRGGATSITTAGGNTWTGLSSIGNGEWGMWGHNNSLAGDLIMYGSRDGSGVTIAGSLSKSSGSFKIPHPLPSKNATHKLVHSFIEGPQADNIYRGVSTLTDGTVTINLDTEAGMTEGTFVLLNTNISCFTSNESDWDAVKGSVSGNILTISCQNSSSTATISWLVIGERHDQHMIDTDWTDDNGKVIVEPLNENNLGDN